MNLYIRLFAHLDNSKLGALGIDFCDSLVSTGIPVRLVPARIAELQPNRLGGSVNQWDRHRNLLITPMNGDFVNCVCGTYEEWGRFYTSCVPNFLLIDPGTDHGCAENITTEQIEKYASFTAKYDRVISVGTSPAELFQFFVNAALGAAHPNPATV
jgi:hypothetical protein